MATPSAKDAPGTQRRPDEAPPEPEHRPGPPPPAEVPPHEAPEEPPTETIRPDEAPPDTTPAHPGRERPVDRVDAYATGGGAAPASPPRTPEIKRTRISGTWVAVIVAAIVLVFLLIFILQNLTAVTVNLLGFSWSIPLGVGMLFAAIAGMILVALIGTARILQLRRFARRVGTRH